MVRYLGNIMRLRVRTPLSQLMYPKKKKAAIIYIFLRNQLFDIVCGQQFNDIWFILLLFMKFERAIQTL